MPTDLRDKYKKAEDVTDSLLLRLAANPLSLPILVVVYVCIAIYLIL